MSLSSRLDRMHTALSAKERALLVLNAWKEDRDADWRTTFEVPPTQAREYDRLIDLMNGVNRGFGTVVMVLEQQISQVELKAGWLTYIMYTGKHVRALAAYMMETKEPITESGLRRRTEEARAEAITLEEAAALLTDEHAFAEDESVEDDGQPCASNTEWDQVYAEKRKAIRDAIDAGTLPATGKRARARVAAGDLCDWAGRPVYVMPDWAMEFDVRPDAEEEAVRAQLAGLDLVRKVIQRICPSDGLLDPDALPEGPDHEAFATGMAQTLACATVQQVRVYWSQPRAFEVIVAEVAEEFDGEDPLRPYNRERIDEAKARLQKLAEEMQEYVGELVLPEPDESDLTQPREFLERIEDE